MNRSRTVVVVAPLFAVHVVVVRSISAPPSAPASIRANDSSVRIAPARVLLSRNSRYSGYPGPDLKWRGRHIEAKYRKDGFKLIYRIARLETPAVDA